MYTLHTIEPVELRLLVVVLVGIPSCKSRPCLAAVAYAASMVRYTKWGNEAFMGVLHNEGLA